MGRDLSEQLAEFRRLWAALDLRSKETVVAAMAKAKEGRVA